MIVLILPPLEGNAPIDIYIREGNEVKNHSAVEQVQTSPALKKFWKQIKFFPKDCIAQGVAKQLLIETIAKPEESIINDP